MPIRTYKKKVTSSKTGETTVYEYQKDTSIYSVRSYNKKKETQAKIECPVCGKMTYPFYMRRHQAKPVCKPKHQASIETPEINI